MTLTVDRLFSEKLLKTTMAQMYDEIARHNQSAIKLTISVSNFNHINHKTLSLIDISDDIVEHKMSIEIQELRDKFGLDIIKNANEL
jgi:DNA polymerase-4